MIVFVFSFSTIGEHFFVKANSDTEVQDQIFDESSKVIDLTVEDYEEANKKELNALDLEADMIESDDFNEEILDPSYDIEEAVEEVDVATMNAEEKKQFVSLVKETVQLSGTDAPELLEESLVNVFDSRSDTFNDLEAAQTELENNYEEQVSNDETAMASLIKNTFSTTAAEAANKGRVRIGANFAGSLFNVAIGMAVGGGIAAGTAAVRAYIVKKGKKAAAKTISRVATAKAKQLGIWSVRTAAIGTTIAVAVNIALDYMNVGAAISRYIDSKDWYRNNGWIDITK